ncbi:MAG: SDR family NAD(P)-dependent oxidoreductase, partial [Myxococcota bacterium]
MKLLESKVAIVTGASQGIGAAIARQFSHAGASVVVNYFQSESAAHRLVEELRKGGGKALAVRADVRQKADVDAMVGKTVETFGGVDVLVNNALHNYRFDPAANPSFEA